MRFLIALLSLIPLQAMSLQELNSRPGPEQSKCVVAMIDKLTSDLAAKNPPMADAIRDYFTRHNDGKPVSDGMEKLYVELTVLERQAKEGKADLSQIQLEGVIVHVIRQKFPPKQ